MSSPPSPDITLLLRDVAQGKEGAEGLLMEHVYAELHRIARAQFRRAEGGSPMTLQATAVVHEAYLKLVRSPQEFEGRRHFLNTAARAMRQVLLNHARDKQAHKRGSGRVGLTLHENAHEAVGPSYDALELEEALQRLEALDPRQAHVVELRFFGGLSIGETAEVLQVSPTTVKEEWRMARAELALLLGRGS